MHINTFMIGADPEYYAINKDNLPVNVKRYTTKEAANVAWDHSGDVLEVKPMPSKYAFRLVRRIRKLLLQSKVSKKLMADNFRFRAGGYVKLPERSLGLGGHIHFDFPYTTVSKDVLHALNSLTSLLEYLDILPKKDSLYRHRYAEVNGIYRMADNADRFEYRYMCSWLHSPVTSQVCLTAAKLAAAYPNTLANVKVEYNWLEDWFELFKGKDSDADRVIEKIFEPKLKLEARIDLNLEDTWRSLKVLERSN